MNERNIMAIALLGMLLPGTAQADDRCLEFQVAAMHNDVSKVERFLGSGVNVDCLDPIDNNQTALMKAATNGSIEAVRMLLARGAIFDRRSDEGWRALEYAEAVRAAVAQGDQSFDPLRRRLDTVIDILKDQGG